VRPGNVVSDSDAWTQRLLLNQQSIAVISHAQIEREISEGRKPILHISAQRAAGLVPIKNKWMRRVEVVHRIGKHVTVVILQIVEKHRRIETEVFVKRRKGRLPAKLNVVSVL